MLSSYLPPKRNLDLFLQNGMKGKYRAEGLFGVRDLTDTVKLALVPQKNKATIGEVPNYPAVSEESLGTNGAKEGLWIWVCAPVNVRFYLTQVTLPAHFAF